MKKTILAVFLTSVFLQGTVDAVPAKETAQISTEILFASIEGISGKSQDFYTNIISTLETKKARFECAKITVIYHGCTAKIYCNPRSLKQKQIFSLQKACEKEPRDECYTDRLIKYMDEFKESEFYEKEYVGTAGTIRGRCL